MFCIKCGENVDKLKVYLKTLNNTDLAHVDIILDKGETTHGRTNTMIMHEMLYWLRRVASDIPSIIVSEFALCFNPNIESSKVDYRAVVKSTKILAFVERLAKDYVHNLGYEAEVSRIQVP
jgi:hypothetical protein